MRSAESVVLIGVYHSRVGFLDYNPRLCKDLHAGDSTLCAGDYTKDQFGALVLKRVQYRDWGHDDEDAISF